MNHNSQHIFDTVVNHLRTQHAKSVALNSDGSVKMMGSSPVCLYRSADGKMKCAAGALITDEEYKHSMEGMNIIGVIDRFDLTRLKPHRSMISELQAIHDLHPVEEWEDRFQRLAQMFGLTYTPPTP